MGVLRPPGQGEAGEQPRPAHHHGPAEQPPVILVQAHILHRDGPGALAHNGDVVAVAAEVGDVLLHPPDGRQLVVQAEVAVPAVLRLYFPVGQVAQHPHPVVGEHGDDAPRRQRPAVKGGFAVHPRVEPAPVEEHHHRAGGGAMGRVNVQVEAVLVIGKMEPLPEFLFEKPACGVFQMLVPRPVLGAAGAEPGGVQLALPARHRLRVAKPLRPGVGHAQKGPAVLPPQPPHIAAPGVQQNGVLHTRFPPFRAPTARFFPIIAPFRPRRNPDH